MSVTPLSVALTGGRTATIARATRGFPRFVALRIEGGGMAPYVNQEWAPGLPAARRGASRDSNLDDTSMALLAEQAMAWAQQAHDAEASAAASEEVASNVPYGLIQRLISQPASESVSYPTSTPEDVVALLKRSGMAPNTVIEWEKRSTERLVLLDLDFHDEKKPKPTESELEWLGEDLSPAPWIWWRTHGGGLKALYAPIAHAPYTAIELAAGAAAQCLVTPFVVRCGGTAELITRTRHPKALHNGKPCGPVHETIPTDYFMCLQRFSAAGATETEIEDVMEDNGLVFGQRLDHDMCLIDPSHPSKSPPVMVTETGLYCHSCAGRGLGGFMSWGFVRKKFGLTQVESDDESAPIRQAIKHFAHFNHVSYLLGAVASEIPAAYQRPLYAALLKKAHGEDPRVGSVFNKFAYVRGKDYWLYADTLLPVGRDLNMADVSVLPSVKRLLPDGETALSQELVSPHTNHGSIEGWAPIAAARFVPIYAQFNTPLSEERATVCRPMVMTTKKHVMYREPEKRVSQEVAEQRILDYFPGISIQYMKALLIAMGVAESGRGSIPILWATGATEAAKTTTIRIILEMFGEEFQSLSDIPEDRLDQIFGESLEQSRIVVFDDFAKEPEDYKRFHTFFIRLNRSGHTYHKLRHGRYKVPVNSAVLLTDWRTPIWFMNEKQFGRRVHIIHLERLPVGWESLKRRLEGWWNQTPEMLQAAESFFSYIVDEFFGPGDTENFEAKMTKIGVHKVADEAGSVNEQREILGDMVHELVEAIVRTPVIQHGHDEKRLGRGFREIVWGEGQEIGRLCSALVDSLGDVPKNQENLHHVLEPFKLDLHKMFPLKFRATLDIKDYGRKTYIRLIQESGALRSPIKLINEELFEIWPIPPGGFPRHAQRIEHVPPVNGHANGNGHHAVNGAPTIPVKDFHQFMTPAAPPAQVQRAEFNLPQFSALLPKKKG